MYSDPLATFHKHFHFYKNRRLAPHYDMPSKLRVYIEDSDRGFSEIMK